MIASLQRIAGALLAIALLALTAATSYQLAFFCAEGQSNCLLAAVTFGISNSELPQPSLGESPESSVAISLNAPSTSALLLDLVQMLSIYLILISVLIIVVLEFFELRYLKQLTKMKRA